MNTHRRKHSLRGLRTFCVAARALSFREAAEALFLTASAVSRQIKSLEEEMGFALFDRSRSTIELTDEGQLLFNQIDHLIRELDSVTANYRNQPKREELRISVQPFFSSELLVPQLASFSRRFPHIDLNLDATDELWEKHPASADASIRLFRRVPPGLEAHAFLPLRQVPACSPELFDMIRQQDTDADTTFPLLRHSARRDEWEHWCQSAAINVPPPSTTITLNSTVALISAAEQGLGVALAPIPAANARFEQGSLVRLYDHEVVTPYRYYFVTSQAAARLKSMRQLRSWVIDTFQEE